MNRRELNCLPVETISLKHTLEINTNHAAGESLAQTSNVESPGADAYNF